MMSAEAFFKEHDLFNKEKLLQKAEHDLVYVIESKRFPNLVMLHYKDECQFDKKWTTLSRMSRGLIVDMKNQKILAYPFDKFFNLGQMLETNYDVLKSYGKFEVSEKLDGSMLILFQDPNTGEFHFTTKGSFDSDHGKFASTLVPEQFKDPKLLEAYTFVFELIYPEFQNVIDYKKKGYAPGIYLIGVRHRRANKMLPYKLVQAFAREYKVPTLKTYQFNSLDEIIEKAKGLPVLEEGYVLLYENDLRVKIKGTEYLRVHRFISKLSDKHLLEVMMDGDIDAMIDIAPEEYKDDVINKVNEYKRKRLDIVNMVYQKFSIAPKDARKDFALWVQKNVDKNYLGLMFTVLDNKPLTDQRVYKLILKVEKPSADTKI